MALDRKKMSQALTNGLARPASNPYGDGSWVKCKDDGALPEDAEEGRGADQGVRQAGQVQDAVHRDAARPRQRPGASSSSGRTSAPRWRSSRSTRRRSRRAPSSASSTSRRWRIVDFPDPDLQMFANFYSKSPLNLANFTDPELDKAARARAGHARRGQAHRVLLRRSAASSTRTPPGSGPSRTPTTPWPRPR